MKSTLINVCDRYKCLCVFLIRITLLRSILKVYPVLLSCPGWVRDKTAYEESIHRRKVQTVSVTRRLFSSSSVPFCSASEKRSHRQQIEIANIHISAEPSLDLSPNILSVSICLQFFSRSLPPSLPLSCSTPIGSRSCSTGRLLSPSHQNLAKAAHICPHTNRSLAFCLWMDGTESEGRDKVKGGKRNTVGQWGGGSS